MNLGNMTDKEILDTAYGKYNYNKKDEMCFSISDLLKFARQIELVAQRRQGILRYDEGRDAERQRTLDALETAIKNFYWDINGAPQVTNAIGKAKRDSQKSVAKTRARET